MRAGEKQSEKLPVTTSSIITESKGSFMGLDGMGFFYVMGVFAVVNVIGNNFLLSTVVAVVVYAIMKTYMSGKPDGFLEDIMVYSMRPKLFEHRPREKRKVIRSS
jgi:hypothetical protein